jgi:hypothetical protein
MHRIHAVAALVATTGAAAFAAAPAGAASTPVAPAPAVSTTFCPNPLGQQFPDGSVVFGTEANGAGCVTVRASGGTVSLYGLIVAPGWTADDKSSRNRVEIRFTQTSTRRQVDVRVEVGRTEVKG